MSDPPGFETIHTLWTAVITVAGGIVAFFTKRLVDEVDKKAERVDVEKLEKGIAMLLDRQDRQHESNTRRLDNIMANSLTNSQKINEVHDSTNSKVDALIAEIRRSEFARGVKSERDKEK